MSPVAELAAQAPLLAWWGAFWTALLRYRASSPPGRDDVRLVLGLALGAVFAHAGWLLLHTPVVLTEPGTALDPTRGASVLFVPLGLLATAPWRAEREARVAYLGAALGALPLALAVARLGCLVAGCCHGVATSLAWGVRAEGSSLVVHPVPAYEIVGLVLLHLAVRRLPSGVLPAAVLAGLGGLRLALEPLRAAPPLGAPRVPPAALAAAWVAAGLALALFERGLLSAPASPRRPAASRPRG